jgi:HK97 family phage prohead protease
MNEQFEFKSAASGAIALDELQGIVECFVAGIGNKDSVGDIVVTGAFAKSLTRRKPRVVWAHSWNDPIGKVLEMYEVPPGDPRLPSKMRSAGIGGLYAKVQFNLQSEKGKEAFASVAFFGEEQEWSIGYKTINGAFDPAQQANVLREVELYEVSPVLHGANQLTGTISVKSEKNHMMPIIAGMPMMGEQQQPRMIVIAAPEKEQEQDEPFNIFAEGLAQPLEADKVQKIQAELSERTGSKVDIVEATDSFIVFRRTTTDGKVSMYRVGYHTPDGYNTFMFGKPEVYSGSDNKPQVQQQIEVKPADTSMVPAQPQQMPYRDDDQDEMNTMLGGQVGVGKSAYAHLIEIPQIHMMQAKSMLQPVFNYHNISTTDSENGIIVNGNISAQAIDALQTAVKAIGQTIGQSVGSLRTLAQSFNPFAIDGDNDGFAQDGTTFQRPYIPIKKPDTELPEVGGKKRNSSELLDKPTIRTGKKPEKDPSLLSGTERQEALAAGDLQPRTMDDISFLANRRPENEGIAKYWDMQEEGLRAEGQKLVAARRGQTGSARETTDAELFKISHEFARREAYKNQFGKDFVPPKRTESTGRETFDYRDLEATDDMIRPAGREFTGYNPFIEKEKEKQRALAQWAEAIAEYEKGRSKRGFSSRGDATPEQQDRINTSRKRGSDIASGRAQILADNLKNLSDEDKDFIRENGIVSFLLQDGNGPLTSEWGGENLWSDRIGDLLPEGDWATDSKLQADAEDIFASYEEGFYGQLDKEFADLVNPADLDTPKTKFFVTKKSARS